MRLPADSVDGDILQIADLLNSRFFAVNGYPINKATLTAAPPKVAGVPAPTDQHTRHGAFGPASSSFRLSQSACQQARLLALCVIGVSALPSVDGPTQSESASLRHGQAALLGVVLCLAGRDIPSISSKGRPFGQAQA